MLEFYHSYVGTLPKNATSLVDLALSSKHTRKKQFKHRSGSDYGTLVVKIFLEKKNE